MSPRAHRAKKMPAAAVAMVPDLGSNLAGSYQMRDVDAPAKKASQINALRSMHVKVSNQSGINNAL